MSGKMDIRSMTRDELQEALVADGLPRFRAGQVFRWLQARGVTDFSEMTDLSRDLREKLAEKYEIYSAKALRVQRSNWMAP